MIGTLDVLIVDDRPETVRFLAEFLIQRCRRVDVASSVREATTAMTRRRAAKETYHLIISDFVMPEADGLALLRELRQRQDDTPFVFATGYRALNPAFEPEAKRLGALAILDKPIDLKLVEELLGHATGIFRRRQEERASDQPFFGTSRTMRRPTGAAAPPTQPSQALEPRQPPPDQQPLPMPITNSWVNPAAALEPSNSPALEPRQTPSGAPQALPPTRPPPVAVPLSGYQRRPSGVVSMPSGTSRIRRGVDPAPPPPGTGTGRIGRTATPQPPTSFTSRVRRGVEGTGSFGRSGHTESGRMVDCMHCNRSFMVLSKPEAYTTVCIHCGQLQRILPA
jgi:CheY-like chemotaxis protein